MARLVVYSYLQCSKSLRCRESVSDASKWPVPHPTRWSFSRDGAKLDIAVLRLSARHGTRPRLAGFHPPSREFDRLLPRVHTLEQGGSGPFVAGVCPGCWVVPARLESTQCRRPVSNHPERSIQRQWRPDFSTTMFCSCGYARVPPLLP